MKPEISHAVEPAELLLANITTDQLSQERYAGLLADYIHRAYMKDAEYAGNGALAQQHYQRFLTGLGVGGKRATTSPNAGNLGGLPSRANGAAEGGEWHPSKHFILSSPCRGAGLPVHHHRLGHSPGGYRVLREIDGVA